MKTEKEEASGLDVGEVRIWPHRGGKRECRTFHGLDALTCIYSLHRISVNNTPQVVGMLPALPYPPVHIWAGDCVTLQQLALLNKDATGKHNNASKGWVYT